MTLMACNLFKCELITLYSTLFDDDVLIKLIIYMLHTCSIESPNTSLSINEDCWLPWRFQSFDLRYVAVYFASLLCFVGTNCSIVTKHAWFQLLKQFIILIRCYFLFHRQLINHAHALVFNDQNNLISKRKPWHIWGIAYTN